MLVAALVAALGLGVHPAPLHTPGSSPGPIQGSPEALMRVTEIAPSGTAFESWSNSDVVGMHSRILINVALSPLDLARRIRRLEDTRERSPLSSELSMDVPALLAGTTALATAIETTLAHADEPVPADLGLRVDRAIALAGGAPEAPTGQHLEHLLTTLSEHVAERTGATAAYHVEVLARLQPLTASSVLPWAPTPITRVHIVHLTPPDAPPAWIVHHRPDPLPTALGEELHEAVAPAAQDGWRGALSRLDDAIRQLAGKRGAAATRRNALLRLQADARALTGNLDALRQHLRAQLEDSVQRADVQGYIPTLASLDLDTLPERKPGQHVVLLLVLARNGHPVALLDERNLTLHKVGLYTELKAGLNFVQNPNAPESRPYNFPFALTALAKWGYRTGFTESNRDIFANQTRLRGLMGGGALMWNEVWDPGLGLNLCSPGLGGNGFEPGVGVSLTFFKDVIQVGRGYDFATGQFYWFGGLGLPWSLGDLVGF